VFPVEFEFSSASSSSLICVNLDDSNKVLDCTLNAAARLLVMKINSTTFVPQRSLRFTVTGAILTNPTYSVNTSPFLIQNYYLDSNNV